ncbi:YolD-like family protein [Macrococcus animalis]|uniref:YolD-like family protein n=1 Tax=Macrococcus animalis TaxID=3395467 RepID=UPI0039BDF334
MKVHNLNDMHPTVPDYLIEETDYRNIPVQYLQRNIPKGRGMIKWAPFATMPQQYEDVRRQIKSQTYQHMPHLSDEQIIDINIKLHHYMFFPSACKIKYFENHQINELDVVIEKILEHEKKAIVFDCYTRENKVLEFKFVIEVN